MQNSLELYNQLMEQMREEAREELRALIDGGGPAKKTRKANKASPKAKAPKAAKATRAKPAEIEKLIGSLKAYVSKHPDQTLEEISTGMAVPTAKLKGPAKKLLAEKVFSRKGVARGSRYRIKA